MRAILVTSRVTFVPRNYFEFLETLLADHSHLISGVIFIDNLNLKVTQQSFSAAVSGARLIAFQLARNMVTAAFSDERVALCRKQNIPCYFVKSMNLKTTQLLIKKLMPDIIINARTRDIYKKKVLAIPKIGCLNIHHGILPNERGVMCDLHALAAKEPAGFSIHRMTPKLDDGDILKTCVVTPSGGRDFLEHVAIGAKCEANAVAKILEEIASNNAMIPGVANTSHNISYRTSKFGLRDVQALKRMGMRI